MSIVVGDRVRVTTATAPARKSPGGPYSTSKGKKILAKKGHSFIVTRLAKSKDGTTWARTSYGNWFSTKRLAIKNLTTPVPGRPWVTGWRKKPPYRNGRPLYWTTRGYHTGTDWPANTGEPVRAVTGGIVHRRWDAVLGNVCLLYSTNGDTYWSCHLSAYVGADGRRVKIGDVIGKVGATGTGAQGPHLHMERRSGHTTSWAGKDTDPTKGW